MPLKDSLCHFTTRRLVAAFCFALLLLGTIFPASFLPGARAQQALDDQKEESISQEQAAQQDAETRQISQDPTLSVREKLDALLRRYATMGASIAVIENGEIIFTHTYGTRQKKGEAVTEDTAFQVGSISKMVTGMGLMRLVEEQGISLEAELGDLLGISLRNPQYPTEPVTLRQLMSHTAGLRDGGFYNNAILGKGRQLSDVFSDTFAKYAFLTNAPPGAKESYSNFGGGLAGSLIEALSGQTLDAYMKKYIFEPLGITAGYQAALLPQSLPLADMYAMPSRYSTKVLREDPSRITQPNPMMHYYLSAGKLIISAPDLAKLLIALCDGGIYGDVRLLMESTVAEMTTLQNRRGSVRCDSNRGLYMNIIENNQVEGRTMYGHGGKAYGMLCAAYFDPTDRTGVVMLTNGCNNRKTYNDVGFLGRAVMQVCYEGIIEPNHQNADPFLVEE